MLEMSAAVVLTFFLGGGGGGGDFYFAEISANREHRQGVGYQALRPRIPPSTPHITTVQYNVRFVHPCPYRKKGSEVSVKVSKARFYKAVC
jgi:hypothetical protein